MNPEVQNEVGMRLKCVQGHVRGVRLMVADERPASDVLQQLHALQGSLRKVRELLLKEHLSECLLGGGNPLVADAAGLQEALDQILQFHDKN